MPFKPNGKKYIFALPNHTFCLPLNWSPQLVLKPNRTQGVRDAQNPFASLFRIFGFKDSKVNNEQTLWHQSTTVSKWCEQRISMDLATIGSFHLLKPPGKKTHIFPVMKSIPFKTNRGKHIVTQTQGREMESQISPNPRIPIRESPRMPTRLSANAPTNPPNAAESAGGRERLEVAKGKGALRVLGAGALGRDGAVDARQSTSGGGGGRVGGWEGGRVGGWGWFFNFPTQTMW